MPGLRPSIMIFAPLNGFRPLYEPKQRHFQVALFRQSARGLQYFPLKRVGLDDEFRLSDQLRSSR